MIWVHQHVAVVGDDEGVPVGSQLRKGTRGDSPPRVEFYDIYLVGQGQFLHVTDRYVDGGNSQERRLEEIRNRRLAESEEGEEYR